LTIKTGSLRWGVATDVGAEDLGAEAVAAGFDGSAAVELPGAGAGGSEDVFPAGFDGAADVALLPGIRGGGSGL
jgi:hypothetical protein